MRSTTSVFRLVGADASDEAALDVAADERRFVHEHEHVYRVAVTAFCARDRSEVVRERMSRRQNAREPKAAELFVEFIFISRAAACR